MERTQYQQPTYPNLFQNTDYQFNAPPPYAPHVSSAVPQSIVFQMPVQAEQNIHLKTVDQLIDRVSKINWFQAAGRAIVSTTMVAFFAKAPSWTLIVATPGLLVANRVDGSKSIRNGMAIGLLIRGSHNLFSSRGWGHHGLTPDGARLCNIGFGSLQIMTALHCLKPKQSNQGRR